MTGSGVIKNKTDINAVVHKEVRAPHVSSRSERQQAAALRRSSCCLAAVNAIAYVKAKFHLAS